MRASLASRDGRKSRGPVVLQVGAPGLYVMDDPSVKVFAKAFYDALGVRKQDILAVSVSDIMQKAGEQLDEEMDIRTLNGDEIETAKGEDVRPGAGQGAGEDQQPADRGLGAVQGH